MQVFHNSSLSLINEFNLLPFSSPIGEIFRARLRQFPSLVNCCTIDWFSEWPEEALQSVASTFLGEIHELEDSPYTKGLVRTSLIFGGRTLVFVTICMSVRILEVGYFDLIF